MTRIRFASLFLVGCLAACDGSNQAEFGPSRSLPKDHRPTVWDSSIQDRLGLQPPASGQNDPHDSKPRQWSGTTPAGWESLPAEPARFRHAQWKVTGEPQTDCYLTVGVGGGVPGNLKRWYSDQFGIATVPAPEALPVAELAGRAGRLAEITGTLGGKPGQAALIAFYHDGDQVTSLKFTGPESIVLGNKDKFMALAKSVRSSTASADAKAPPIEPGTPMPASHPDIGTAANGGTAPPATGPFTATIPAGWTAKAGSARWQHHTFGAGGEVYVGQLGGTLAQNFEIWRGEFQLGALDDAAIAALPKVAFLGDDSVLLDLAGKFRSFTGKEIADARVLVAARHEAGATVFVKLVGTAAEVAPHLEAFRQFCGSLRRTQ